MTVVDLRLWCDDFSVFFLFFFVFSMGTSLEGRTLDTQSAVQYPEMRWVWKMDRLPLSPILRSVKNNNNKRTSLKFHHLLNKIISILCIFPPQGAFRFPRTQVVLRYYRENDEQVLMMEKRQAACRLSPISLFFSFFAISSTYIPQWGVPKMLCNLSKIIDGKKKKRITEERGGKEKEKTEEDVYSYNDY